MKRGMTGRYEVTATAGEQVRAFVPAPLPPNPPLRMEGDRQRRRPVATIASLSSHAGVSFPTAARSVDGLAGLGIVREITGRSRDRVFVYSAYLAILNEGAEPL